MRMHSGKLRAALAVAALPLVFAYGIGLPRNGAAAATSAAIPRSVITIRNFSFDPGVVTVHAGATVVWINRDDDVHTIKSQDGPEAFQSPALDSGARFERRFRHAGTYRYICSVHPFMHGVVVVR